MRAKKKKMSRRLPVFRITALAALLWLPVSLIYYFLPQEIRRPIYQAAPRFDRMLRRSGFHLISGWDELGMGGRDCTAPADGKHDGRYAYGGLPAEGLRLRNRARRLENTGYAVGYSEALRNPLWAAYRLFDVPSLESADRPAFKKDTRSAAGVRPEDFTGSGFDRGHLAPNFGIVTRYGADAQQETFLMTNIMPQEPLINRYLWRNLEHRIAAQYGRYFGEVWVITGPVFPSPADRLPAGIAIPSAYYMIVSDTTGDRLRAMAFLVDRKTAPWTRIRTCLVSIDHLEELTGLDFFPDLPDAVQDELEREAPSRLWPWLIPAVRYHFFGKIS